MKPGMLLYAVVRGIVAAFVRVFFRLTIEGRENLPAHGAYVVSAVHRSNVDSFVLAALTRRRFRYLGKDSLWKHRLPAAFFNAMGGVPVSRGTADRESLRRCIEALQGGEPLVVFPEGTRQSGPKIQPLFEGAAYMASRTGVPIVPVGIGGSEGAMPKGSKMIRPVHIHVIVGEPIPPPSTDGARVPRAAIKQQTDRLATDLQRLFDQAQASA